MVPSNFTESQRTEVSKVKWFTDGVSFVSNKLIIFRVHGCLSE